MASPKWHVNYLSMYLSMYLTMYLTLTFVQVYIGAGKFGEYTHFIETSSTGLRDMLGHSRGKL